jgi:hypothetical protein
MMKKSVLMPALVILAALFPSILAVAPVSGMDLEITGGLGNISFDRDRTSPLGDDDKTKTRSFTPNLFPFGVVKVSGEAGNSFYYNALYERDPILGNMVCGNIGARLNFISLEAGPVIGLFNAAEKVNPGFSVAVGLEFPGILFARLKAGASLGNILSDSDDYSHKSGGISAGFWVPFVVCSFNMETKSSANRENAYLLIEDSLNRYYFRAEVYTKNVPYTIQVDLGFESLSRSYASESINSIPALVRKTETDEYKAMFLGLEASYTIFPGLKAILGARMPLYSWSVKPMQNPAKNTLLFSARAGIIWTLPEGAFN